MLSRTAETLALLGDETRLRLCALLRGRELRVTDLVRITGIPQSRVSTHLGRLKEARYVVDRREGQQSFYALTAEELSPASRALLEELVGSPDPTLQSDRARALELEAARRGEAGAPLEDDIERDYSPGRSWRSLALGLAAGLELGAVLDIGCGDGAASACVSPYCRALVCIDSDPAMVQQARERFAAESHVQVRLADAHALPSPAEAFDTVLLFHTLTYAEAPAQVLSEGARVLRKGGRMIVLCLDQHDHRDVTRRYRERHPGFSPAQAGNLLSAAGLEVSHAGVACREDRKPHLQVVLAVAAKPSAGPRRGQPPSTHRNA